jgi:L-alanine-DL-glutamate epimerase-like enolase superfamily enzyme
VLFADTPEQTAEMAKQYVEMGLTAVKFGWGPIGDDAAVDVAHVQAAREAIGEERDLMVDAGHAWDWETALGRTELFKPFNLTWLEEPVGQDDRHGYRELCKRSPIPIAGGEGDVTHFDFKELIDCGLHVVQPDIAFCGGITVCKRVSDMTTAHGRKAVPHCFSTGINLAASLHWISTVADGDLVEYCLRPSPLMRKLVANLPQVISGRVPVPTEPGLGIELDEDVIEEFRVR